MRKFIANTVKILPILGFLYYRLIHQGILFIESGWTIFSNITAILIFGYLWIEFATRFEEALVSFLNYLSNKDSKNLADLKVKLGYYFPSEIFLSSITFLFGFGVYHWFTSNPVVIAISSVLFKNINRDIPHLLISSVLGVVSSSIKLPQHEYIKNTHRLPNNFYSCIYIPQKSNSINGVIAGIRQGIRAYLNNLNQSGQTDHLGFIYHSDTSDKTLREQELAEILDAKEKFKRIFILFRNQKANNPTFLKKPGGYMSDYQILTHGIWHPVTYVSKVSDARRQVRVKRDKDGNIIEIRPHIPFTAPLDNNGRLIEEGDYEYYIKYRPSGVRKLYIRENLCLIKLGRIVSSSQEDSEPDLLGRFREKDESYQPVKIQTLSYLLDAENPTQYIKQVSGDLFDLEGRLLAKSYQWQIDHRGYIRSPVTGKKVKTRIGSYLPERAIQLFSQNFLLPNGKKLILDRKGNLWDYESGKLWATPNDYKVKLNYDLYRFKKKKFQLIQKDIKVSQDNFYGEDFRRLPTDLFNGIDRKELETLVRQNKLSNQEADRVAITGILGDPYLLHIGKTGWEEEYLIEDLEIRYFDKAKKAKSGYVVNQKDGFWLTPEGELIFLGENYPSYSIPKPTLVAEKNNVRVLEKEEIFIDYDQNRELVRHKLLAHSGCWYKDGNGNYRRRKLLAKLELVRGFDKDLNAVIYDPLKKARRIIKCGSFFINEVGIWDANQYSDDEIITTQDGFIGIDERGNLVEEKVLAFNGGYYIAKDGKVVIEGKDKVSLGIFLKFPNQKYLLDEKGNLLEADAGIKIANQTDCDAEFLPHTIKYLNSIAARNIQEQKFPFGMYQPEIGFGNWGRSRFAKLQVWGLAMYKFIARAIYRLFGQTTAYGKMTKFINLYVSNIAFKETLPPIARCHDHWEAMRLKTGLVISYPKEKGRTLVESTPSNFLTFLKRQSEWIGGDLRLLEFETYLGVMLNLIRTVWAFFTKGISETRYWLKVTTLNLKKLKDFKRDGEHVASSHHLCIVRRNIFNPFLFGIWLLLIGVISLIFPGFLSVKSPSLAWFLFFFIITVLIILPKILMPILGKILDSQRKIPTLLNLILLVSLGTVCGWLGMKFFPMVWFSLTLGIGLAWLGYKLVLRPVVNVIFSPTQRLKNRLTWIVILLGFTFLIIYYIGPLSQVLFDIPSAGWIAVFLFHTVPQIFTYAVPIFIFLSLTNQGRAQIETFKRGILEAIYSTSIFLMMIVLMPIILAEKLYFMLTRPNKSFTWQPQASYENDFDKMSTLKVYLYLKTPVIVAILFIIFPVITGLANPSLIFYGWPIFILSWICGPLLVKLSAELGKDKYYNSLAYLGLRDKFKPKLMKLKTDKEIVKGILDIEHEVKGKISGPQKLKLYLLYLTNVDEKILKKHQGIINKLISKQKNFSYRLRERDWNSFSEVARAEILDQLAKSKIFRCPKLELIKAIKDIILTQELQFLGVVKWDDLFKTERIKIIENIFYKHRLLSLHKSLKETEYWKILQPLLR